MIQNSSVKKGDDTGISAIFILTSPSHVLLLYLLTKKAYLLLRSNIFS